jgi:hypothetical protein
MVFRKLTPYLIGVPLGLATWALIAIVVTLFPPAGRPVAVYALGGPRAALTAIVAAGGSILEVRGNLVVAASEDPGFVARLYREAPLVAVLADGGCGFASGIGRNSAKRVFRPTAPRRAVRETAHYASIDRG